MRSLSKKLKLFALRVRGRIRMAHNQCPCCNSSAPAVDNCPVCDGYDYTPAVTEYPPANWRKKEWCIRYALYLRIFE